MDDFDPYDFRVKGPAMTQPTPTVCPKCGAERIRDATPHHYNEWACESVGDTPESHGTFFEQSDRCKIEEQRQEIGRLRKWQADAIGAWSDMRAAIASEDKQLESLAWNKLAYLKDMALSRKSP